MNRLRLQVLDRRVAIEADDSTLLGGLAQLFSALPQLPEGAAFDLVYRLEGERTGYRLLRNGVLLKGGAGREDCFAAIQGDLASFLAQSRTFGLLHAAALLKGDRVVLLPGDSGSGKTTLAAALLQRGFQYLSDEFAPLSLPRLRVRPYPLPLRLRERMLPLLLPLDGLLSLWPEPFWARGERVFYGLPVSRVLPRGEWPVGSIVFPRIEVGGPTEVQRVKPGIAALHLLAHLINAPLLREAGVKAAADLATAIPCYTLTVGEVDAAARLIEDVHRSATQAMTQEVP